MNAALDENKQKQIKNEVTAMENRVSYAKSELEKLNREIATLKKEDEEIRNRLTVDIGTRQTEVRKQAGLVEEERKKLEASKEEFQAILATFKKERVDFEREKQTMQDLKNDAKLTLDRVGSFIRLVRDEAARL